jgi:DNA polymerase III subunit beta
VRVSCLQENLSRGLNIVGRAVSPRSTLPVLGNILLATDEGRLKLAATNLEIGISCWIGAKVEDEGAVTVPSRLLSEFVNQLPAERIDMDLSVRTLMLNLKCARYDTNIKGIDASEFPIIPTSDGADAIRIEADTLRKMINQVVFAAATDESRPTLTGVDARFNGNRLTLAATDGFRLAVRGTELATAVPEKTEVIIPARALSELSRIIGLLPKAEGERRWWRSPSPARATRSSSTCPTWTWSRS